MHCGTIFLYSGAVAMYKECCDIVLTTNKTVLYEYFYAYYAKVMNETEELIINKMFEVKSGNRVEECELRLKLGNNIVNFGLPVIGSIIFIINLLQMVILIKQKSKTKSMVYIFSLSMSDAILGLGAFFYGVLNATTEMPTLPDFFRINICGTMSIVSVFTLIVITFDRLYAVVKPFKHWANPSKTIPIIISIGLWIVAITMVVFYYCVLHKDDKSFNLAILLIPILTFPAVTTFLGVYPYIWYTLRNKSEYIARNKDQERDIFWLAIAIVTVFSLCWLPVSIFGLYKNYTTPGDTETENRRTVVQVTLFTLVIFNSLINPFLYFNFIKKSIKEGARKFIQKRFSSGSQSKTEMQPLQ